MIYLDYSATTPVDDEVLDSYVKVTKEFVGNANSIHTLGMKSKELFIKATKQISDILGVKPKEIIYTSGASESNTTAIKGVAFKYVGNGKHIITSYLEHKSVLDVMDYLKTIGFEIEYVNLSPNGQIDLKDLENKIRKDTILISICAVNSEAGFKAPLKTIRQIINKKNPKTIFHSDMTQALGKTNVYLSDVDLASFSAHKIYAPKGIGALYKKEGLEIEPLIYGLTENTPFRGGTPALPLIVSFSKALRLINDNLESNIKHVERLNKALIKGLSKYKDIIINSNELSVSHIVNISLMKIKSETFVRALEKYDVYISTNTACSSLDESTVISAISNDKNRSTSTIRISLSHKTSMDEVNKFLDAFDKTWNDLLLK